MIINFTISFILLVLISASDARSCITPTREFGTCVSINDCKSKNFLEVIEKKNRTGGDDTFLNDWRCSYKDNISQVCCPHTKECVTSDGKQGQCVSLHYCSHIVSTMLDLSPNDDMAYVNKFFCIGPEKQNVCCGPSPEIQPKKMTPNERCTRLLTAVPPDSASKCCGLDSSAGNKIIGGTDTKIDDYPWLALIEYVKLGETKLLCGGSLISSKYVLTAAHCVDGDILDSGTPKNVRLGEYDTTNNAKDCVEVEAGGIDCTHPVVIVPIDNMIAHPDYKPFDRQKKHDIALIRLKMGPLYTDFIRPICLPSVDYIKAPPENFQFYVAGWGRYVQFANDTKIIRLSSKVKQHVMVPYVPRDKCQIAQQMLHGGEDIMLGSGQICAGGEAGKDSCQGDSGGPLMYQNEQRFEVIGVVSFGSENCGRLDVPSVYTYVYEYLPWIKSTITA